MKKNKLILLQLFIAFILICTSVYAAFDTTISLSASSTSVKQGEEVTVTLSLENVDSNKKVESVEGYINYNKDILEAVTVDSIEKSSNNTVTIGNEELSIEDLTNRSEVSTSDAYVAFNGTPASDNDIKIVIDFKNGVTSNVDLLKIKFKVKSNATLGTVSNAISYEMFQITAGLETSPDITKNVNLTVVAASTEKPENKAEKPTENKVENKAENKAENKVENKTENKVENKATNNTVKNTNNTTNNTNKASNTNTKDNTVAGTNLPATGAKIIVIPAIVLIVLAYISYNKYMKYKDI